MLLYLIISLLAAGPLSEATRDNTERMLMLSLEKYLNALFRNPVDRTDPLHYNKDIEFVTKNGSRYYMRGGNLIKDAKMLGELAIEVITQDANLIFDSQRNLLMANVLDSYSMEFGCHSNTLAKSGRLVELLSPRTAIRFVLESNLNNQFELCFAALKTAIKLALDLLGDQVNARLEQHLDDLLRFKTSVKDPNEFTKVWTQHLQGATLDEPQFNLYNPDFGVPEPTTQMKRDRFVTMWLKPCKTLVDMALNCQRNMQMRLMSDMAFPYMKQDSEARRLFLKVEFCRIVVHDRMLERLYPVEGQAPVDEQAVDEQAAREQSSLFDPTIEMHPLEQYIPLGPPHTMGQFWHDTQVGTSQQQQDRAQ